MAMHSFQVCFCGIRNFIHRVLGPPDDVKTLFKDFSQGGSMSMDGLRNFLSVVQGQNNAPEDDTDDAQAIFDRLKHLGFFQRKDLSLEAFYRYLLGDLNTPLSPSSRVHHDMTAPLAHYFMYTGHNSYLTGNQFSSASSVEPIKRALQNGVRVIELDLWPAANNKVVVCHGRTLTSSVELLKCLITIKEFAFQKSEYPVVITFEDHLPARLQAKVAEMVTKTFREMLHCPGTDQLLEFPSPESLKKKVLISTKPPKEYPEIQNSKSPQMSTESSKEEQRDDETASQNDLETHEVHSSRINLFNCLFMRFAKQDEIDVGEQLQEDDEEIRPPQYKHLIAIHAGKPKGELENWFIINEKGVKRLSLSEQVLENAIRKCGKYITRFTQHNLLRVYPKATRIYSSNYDPFVGWTHGAQMVAFNMQGYGKHLQIMQGMFRANGGCGYVKKPKFLLSKEGFDPTVPLPVKKILVVKIYSGEGWHLDFPNTHFDPYSPPDFFVKVGIAGVDADKAKGETEAVENSWLPEWNEEFKFELTVPELAILMIEVLEKDKYGKHDFGGRTCFPISELRTGIRAVPLHDRRGVKYRNSRLLMKLNLYPSKDAVPEDVRILFQEYSQDGNMSIDGLHKFLNEYQGEKNATKEISRAIFISLKHFNIFRLEAFYQYLLSDLNTPLSPSCNARHDMTAPLAHYFLYTGHNWYLTENQTSSEGSVESIKKALQKGARVIELDLWPSKNNKVVVFHGRTLNGSAELLECLLAIKEFAFRTSEYPVVITFEDHLPADLQAMVGEMVTKTFGGMLFRPARDIPSPQSLKKKVLISTKPPKDDLETQNSKSPQKSKKSPKEEQWDDEKTASKTDLETYDKNEIGEGEQLQVEDGEIRMPEYRHLLAIRARKPKGALQNWLSKDEKEVRCLSLSEQQLENATRTYGKDIIRYTQHNLLRVYPEGTHIDSSNYDPFVGWMHGAQMVAYNMQGYGKQLWVMQGMFRANGGCGYVKKPDFLLREEVFDPSAQLPVKNILKVKISSGEGWYLDFCHMYSAPDLFVKVGIAGIQADKAEYNTNIVKNSWVPEWNKEFEFKLTVPELAVLTVEVLEQNISGKSDFGGQTCLPISELRTGIRAVPLHDLRGEKYKNTRLLMKFDLRDANEFSE